ncbi:CA2D4 protein, partial [Atractosteus spatula]|nr:CA2D4 protein [Atractosteus spatula]
VGFIKSGVPQGLTLGPLLFNIHMFPLGLPLRSHGLNCEKTEVMLLGTSHQLCKAHAVTLSVDGNIPEFQSKGVIFDPDLTFDPYVQHIVKTLFFHHRNISGLQYMLCCHYLLLKSWSTIVVFSRIGYCNALLSGITGKFFGEVDGSVMLQLLNMGMFKKVTLFDYQAMCKMSGHHHSGARPLLSPFYGFLGALKWFLSNLFLFLLEFNFCGFWHSDNIVDAHKHKKHEMLQPCDTEYPAFVYEPSIKETNGLIDCGSCQKMFVVQEISNSNLLMLISQADCDCSNYPPLTLEPKEVKYILSHLQQKQLTEHTLLI